MSLKSLLRKANGENLQVTNHGRDSPVDFMF